MEIPSKELREAEAYVETICSEDCWKHRREDCLWMNYEPPEQTMLF